MTVVTCPTSGPISIANVKAAFPTTNSNSLNDYRGKQWFQDNNDRSYFPGNNSAISLSDFYGKRENSPVTPGSSTYTSGTSITLPALFNTLTVEVYGGGGGGGGGGYLAGITVYSGGNGGTGGATSFGTSADSYYIICSGGGGGGGGSASYISYLYGTAVGSGNGTGSTGADASYSPDQSGVASGGGAGTGSQDSQSHQNVTSYDKYGNKTSWTDYVYANGGPGGKGGKKVRIVLDVVALGYTAISYYYGRSLPVSIGAAGAGGAGGASLAGLNGYAGGAGKIIISWT